MFESRRKFFEAVGAGTVLLTLQACGGGGGGSGPGFGAGCGSSGNAILGNHPGPDAHTLTVPAADLRSGSKHVYSTGGTSDHVHDVPFTADELLQLANGSAVTKTSTLNGSTKYPAHTHQVSVTCP